MRHLLFRRRHKIARGIFRGYTGIKMNTAVWIKLYEILIKGSYFLQIGQYHFLQILLIPGVPIIIAIMLRNPACCSNPVDNDRHYLGGLADSGSCTGSHIYTIHPKKLFSIVPIFRNPVVIIFVKALLERQKVTHIGVPVYHLCVFIGHIVAPHQTIVAGPKPIQWEWVILIGST